MRIRRNMKSLAEQTRAEYLIRGQESEDSEMDDVNMELDTPLLKGCDPEALSKRSTYRVTHRRIIILSSLVLFLLCAVVVLTIGLFYLIIRLDHTGSQLSMSPIPACNIDGQSCVAHRQRFKKGAVASDQPVCSDIGNVILSEKGGSIVDAGIATLICLSVENLQSAGIGGGGFYLLYNRAEMKTYLVNAREKAPLKAFRDMYKHHYNDSVDGGLAIAVPGEVAAYAALHSKFGKLPWKELFAPTISLCLNGFSVGSGLNLAIQHKRDKILKYEGLKEMLVNPKTGDVYKTGDIIKLPKLAKTYQTIADQGAHTYYNGTLSKDIVADIAEVHGIVTEEDLRSYHVELEPSLAVKLSDGNTMHTVPPPSSGSLGALVYNIMNGYKWRKDTLSCHEASVLFHHRVTEAWKYAYSIRYRMGDQDFIDVKDIIKNVTSQEFADYLRSQIDDDRTFDPKHYGPVGAGATDQGTTHLSILDDKGNAFAATTSINQYFGSKIVGSRTGILFDDTMDDFSIPNKPNAFNLPPSKENFIQPGKRPMSTMTPTIITDKDGDVIMVAGASGGSKILSATSYVILRTLLLNDDLKSAVDATRIHHQWIPNKITYEFELAKYLYDGLAAKGHVMYQQPQDERGAVVQALMKEFIQAYCDIRKGGCPSGYN